MPKWETYRAPSLEEMDQIRAAQALAEREATLLTTAASIETALRKGLAARSPWIAPEMARALGERFAAGGWRIQYEYQASQQRVLVQDPRTL